MDLFCFLWAETLSAFDFRLPFQGCLYRHSILEDICNVFLLNKKQICLLSTVIMFPLGAKFWQAYFATLTDFSLSSFGDTPAACAGVMWRSLYHPVRIRTQKPCEYWHFFFFFLLRLPGIMILCFWCGNLVSYVSTHETKFWPDI